MRVVNVEHLEVGDLPEIMGEGFHSLSFNLLNFRLAWTIRYHFYAYNVLFFQKLKYTDF